MIYALNMWRDMQRRIHITNFEQIQRRFQILMLLEFEITYVFMFRALISSIGVNFLS